MWLPLLALPCEELLLEEVDEAEWSMWELDVLPLVEWLWPEGALWGDCWWLLLLWWLWWLWLWWFWWCGI